MSIRTGLGQLAQKEVDRKEFLIYLATMVVALMGVTRMLEALGISSFSKHSAVDSGYGQVPYGSNRR